MGTLTLPSAKFATRGYDVIPQHPLERLQSLRANIELRRSTFSNWPSNANVSAETLSENGFYYLGNTDKVQCAFCGGVLSGWSKHDDVEQEHARHFGKCEFVQNSKKKNVTPGYQFSAPVPNLNPQQCDSTIKPHNTQYSLYSNRVETFKLWPKDFAQKPEDLAASGLYYKGSGDKCQCYMCGGILSDWEAGDLPKEEHKKWFPKCHLSQ